MVNTLAHNWWTLVLRGLAAILFGILLMVLGFRLRNWSEVSFTPPTPKTAGVSK